MVRLHYVYRCEYCVTRSRPKLLHVEPEELKNRALATEGVPDDEEPQENDTTEEVVPHADERQIGLDTDRSFVLYPVGEPHFFLYSERSSCSSHRGDQQQREAPGQS